MTDKAAAAAGILPWKQRAAERWPHIPLRDLADWAKLATAELEIADLHAALKAQPAPTEAQGEPIYQVRERGGASLTWTDHHKAFYDACGDAAFERRIVNLAAQGEDSARLDAYAAQADAILGFAQALAEVGFDQAGIAIMAKGTADRIRKLGAVPQPQEKPCPSK